jgi:hypothetical protein
MKLMYILAFAFNYEKSSCKTHDILSLYNHEYDMVA